MPYDKCQIRFHFHLIHTLKTHSRNTQYPQMLSHGHNDSTTLNTNHHNLIRVSSRSTTLSSPSSSTSSSYNHQHFSNTTTTTMEEVWKDITLSATHHRGSAVKGHCGFILQDFLAQPFSSNDTPTSGSPLEPPTVLNLNPGPDGLNFLMDGSTQNGYNGPFDRVLGSVNSCSELMDHGGGGVRVLPVADGTGGDRRHRRMIKNRESAARSRARKQAYTNELENEVERLKEENAKLKRRQQQLQLATTTQMTKKRGLQRTSTSPF